ncbi:ATP-dependent DNA helicase RecG [hydrothermal vent metagenome]|uniref:ATP-dependent DNA helicase RecG n=1 Tax=hydrothermal vent metagenome TaxID=652676 RepID=A0A3B0TAG2_9ZZZZ
MRPAELTPLFATIEVLPRIGPRSAKTYQKLLGPAPDDGHPRVIDLLWHLPHRLIDRRARPKLAQLVPGTLVTLELTIGEHDVPRPGSRRPYRVHGFDDTGDITLVFFHAHGNYLLKQMPPGETRFVSGKVEEFDGVLQIVHPDYVLTAEDFAAMPGVEPVYPLTAGISNRMMLGAQTAALERLPELPEWLDEQTVSARGWPSFAEALASAHHPEEEDDLSPLSPVRQRLGFDEIFANQIMLAILRGSRRRTQGRALQGPGGLVGEAKEALPFALTAGQEAALGEILGDMARPEQMVRLLQGDVGSGKTAVAFVALAAAIDAGVQGALMAPTEVLARQHFATLAPLFAAIGRRLALLTGREKGAARKALYAELKSGAIDVVVGTHALFQDDVVYQDLGLAVVDEQHRFGVHQRLALQAKSTKGAADLLVMTATPIPRTLLLTHYGNMDVTAMTDRPPGRGRIETRALPLERAGDVVARLKLAIADGARVYWICPQIEGENGEGLKAATARHAALVKALGPRVALAHGRLKPAEKDAAMAAFKSGEVDVLVATTVVEVGVDVPEATIIVIENAERFGLAQLHQLRGRVGRGGLDATCLLLYERPLGEIAAARLDILRQTDDGFAIAEEDLRLRGGGEILGTRQSGLPGFRLADPFAHAPLIEPARKMAEALLDADPGLESPAGRAARTLLYLMERDEAIKLTVSG